MVKKYLSTLLLSTSLSAASIPDSPSSCWTTSEDSAHLLPPHLCRAISSAGSNSTWTHTLDSKSSARQEMVGFGAAWTGTTTYIFDKLSDEDQEGLMKELFTRNDGTEGVGDGIGMEFMRMTGKSERYGGRSEGQLEQQPTPHLLHTVGQSDLTPDGRLSFDENDDKPEPDLTNFDLTEPGGRML